MGKSSRHWASWPGIIFTEEQKKQIEILSKMPSISIDDAAKKLVQSIPSEKDCKNLMKLIETIIKGLHKGINKITGGEH